jgi:hypothetical protein
MDLCMEAMAMEAAAMEAMDMEAVAMAVAMAVVTEAMAMIPDYMVGGVLLWITDTTGPEAVAMDIMVLAMRVKMEQLS